MKKEEMLFDISSIWCEVKRNFANFDNVPHIDWDDIYYDYLGRIGDVDDEYGFYLLLATFVASLNDGHTMVVPSTKIQQGIGTLALEIAAYRRRPVITRGYLDIEPGSIIEEIDGEKVETYIKERIEPHISASTDEKRFCMSVRSLFIAEYGTTVSIKLQCPNGRQKATSLNRCSKALFPPESLFASNNSYETKVIDGTIGYIKLESFLEDTLVERFRETYKGYLNMQGIVIDIRGNPGGNSSIAEKIARIIAKEAFYTQKSMAIAYDPALQAVMSWRNTNDTDSWKINESRLLHPEECEKCPGDVAVLIDTETNSGAEDFLVCLDAMSHVVKVGRKTSGSTGQPLLLGLRSGNRAIICTVKCLFPDGRSFVGKGICPDIEVDVTLDELLGKRDITLNKAVEYLKGG